MHGVYRLDRALKCDLRNLRAVSWSLIIISNSPMLRVQAG